jgi:hypothetical protein
MALKKLKAWKVINGEAPVALDFYDDDPQALSAACKDWLLETSDEDDVSTQKVTSNRKKFEKHHIYEYEQWEGLNGVALSEILRQLRPVYPTLDWEEEERCRGVEATGEQLCRLWFRLG